MKEDVFSLWQYNYQIPKQLIAQESVVPRDSCRLLIIERKKSLIKEDIFRNIPKFFTQGDVLILNNTKVIKARLRGKKETGGRLDILLLKEQKNGLWQALVKPGQRIRINDKIIFEGSELVAKIVDKTNEGIRLLAFEPKELKKYLPKIGRVPLPPYIKKDTKYFGGYQTVYAKKEGAVAAPTAGLHFTKKLINELQNKGVKVISVTLHCSLATFRPVKTPDIRDHKIEPEWIEVSAPAAKIINQAKEQRKKIIAVGTTGIRALESVALGDKQDGFQVKPFSGNTNLYIVPGYKFKIIDALITNFHTPFSTNLILICAFCGLKLAQEAYAYARKRNFSFFSFGDAMLIL